MDPRRRRWRGGTYYRPRFGNNRGGGRFARGGGYRDFRQNRWGRGFGWGGGPRNNRFRSRDRFDSRRSRSVSRGSRDSRSPDNRRSDRKSPPPPPEININHSNGDNENFMKKQLAGDPSIEEIEQILDKAKKDNKEEMLERNKDLAKRSN